MEAESSLRNGLWDSAMGGGLGLSGCVDSPSAAMESACIQSSIQPLVNQPHSRLRCTWAGPVHHAPLETTAVTG